MRNMYMWGDYYSTSGYNMSVCYDILPHVDESGRPKSVVQYTFDMVPPRGLMAYRYNVSKRESISRCHMRYESGIFRSVYLGCNLDNVWRKYDMAELAILNDIDWMVNSGYIKFNKTQSAAIVLLVRYKRSVLEDNVFNGLVKYAE